MNKPAQKDVEQEENFEAVDDSGFELEIIDDTPEEDKERPRRSEDAEANVPEDDEISSYGENVQKRIKQLKYEFHEERRRKEEASRLQEEAVTYAQKVHEENQRLKKTLAEGEGVLVEQAKGRVEAELDKAKAAYKEAYEIGDPDKLIEAQEKLTSLQNEKFRVQSYKPKVQEVEQLPENIAAKPKVAEPDDRTKQWAAENSWFGEDTEMTGFAFGVHESLVKNGINPQTQADEYYSRIDESMRQRFPDKFGGQEV